MRPLLALLLFFSTSCFGYTGNDLIEDFEGGDVSFAVGFTQGVARTASEMGLAGRCINWPSGITGPQVQKIVRKYLENNPQYLHLVAHELVLLSLVEAFGVVEANPDGEDHYCPYGRGDG